MLNIVSDIFNPNRINIEAEISALELGVAVNSVLNILDKLGRGVITIDKAVIDLLGLLDGSSDDTTNDEEQIVDVFSLIGIVTSLFDNSKTIEQVVNDIGDLLGYTLYSLADISFV